MQQTKKQKSAPRDAEEINHVKGLPIKTAMGELMPSLSDKLKDGRKINTGSMVMGMAAGTCTVNGEKLNIIHDMGASVTLLAKNGRYFRLDMETFVNHAVESGLLDPAIRFEEKND